MTVKIRTVERQFQQTHTTKFKNLLVSGCSFTYNNHETAPVAWPYYLRDLAGFDNVYDCSQMAAGTNHIFNSIVNEVETNQNISCQDTLIIIMWSGLTRTDYIATQDVTQSWHNVSNYCFDSKFSTLSLFPGGREKNAVADLSKQHRLVVDPDAQIFESLLKIIALDQYLKSKKFQYVFISWMDPQPELLRIHSALTDQVYELLNTVPYIWEFAVNTNQIGESHPTPDAHLSWTKDYLLPRLTDQQLTKHLNTV